MNLLSGGRRLRAGVGGETSRVVLNCCCRYATQAADADRFDIAVADQAVHHRSADAELLRSFFSREHDPCGYLPRLRVGWRRVLGRQGLGDRDERCCEVPEIVGRGHPVRLLEWEVSVLRLRWWLRGGRSWRTFELWVCPGVLW